MERSEIEIARDRNQLREYVDSKIVCYDREMLELVEGFFQVKLTTTPFCLFVSFYSFICSFVMRDASRIYNPSTKAICCLVVVKGRTFVRRFDSTLAMILYSTVARLMS